MLYLLDTNTCIDLMRNRATVLQRIAKVSPADCVDSTISIYELYTGVARCARPVEERGKVDRLLAAIQTVLFDIDAAQQAARIRTHLQSQGQPIGPYDLLIAGHALSLKLVLVSANAKEFARVPGLVGESW